MTKRYRITLETVHYGGNDFYKWWIKNISRGVHPETIKQIMEKGEAVLINDDVKNGTKHVTTYKVEVLDE